MTCHSLETKDTSNGFSELQNGFSDLIESQESDPWLSEKVWYRMQTYLTGIIQQLLDRYVRSVLLHLVSGCESVLHSVTARTVFLQPVF